MCGIIGKVDLKGSIDVNGFIKQRDTMTQRGPDDGGVYFNDDFSVALGYRRLSINDLSQRANQPLANENKTVFVVCNGEIYNSPALRTQLINKGHFFYSNSDNEVIVHGYEEWDLDIINKIDGMFAFGLWDSLKKKMMLARDRFGIKPLYYEFANGQLTFASAINAITMREGHPKKISLESVCNYLTYRYVPSPATIFENIYKIEPGHYITFDFEGSLLDKCYWTPVYNPIKINRKEAAEHTELLLKESVKKHLLSDVPVGCFLSSGMDSSALAVLLKKLNYSPQTFSIGFDSWKNSEHLIAGNTAATLGFMNIGQVLNEHNFLPEEVIMAYDEPLADISIVPTFFVSKNAATYVKTVFSGEGADELFGGYDWYFHTYNEWNKGSLLKKTLTTPNRRALTVYDKYMEMGAFNREELQKLFNEDYHQYIPEESDWFYKKHYDNSLPFPKSLQKLDIRCFMGELVLNKVDRASMANSLEVRVPYLDYNLFDFMFNLHPEQYFNPPQRKPLLAGIVIEYLPGLEFRKKQGFVGPDNYYHKIDFYKKIIYNSTFSEKQVFSKHYIDTIISANDYWRLWKLAVFSMWMQKNL